MTEHISEKYSIERDENCRPTITTERLIIRPLSVEKGDAESIVSLFADDNLRRWFGVEPIKTISEAETLIKNYGRSLHAVTEKGKDKLIGLIQAVRGSRRYRYDPFIGYCLSKEYEGMGYMTEAVLGMEAEIFSNWMQCICYGCPLVDRIYAHVFAGNDASSRVLSRCGFHFVGSHENVNNPYGMVDDLDTFCTTVGDFEWIMRNAA